MKNKLHYSPESLQDLDEIYEYITMELFNTDAALKVINDMMSTIDKLEDFAEMGKLLSSVASVKSDYRFLISGSYLAFYRVTDAAVYIDRILYGKRDYLRILFDHFPAEK